MVRLASLDGDPVYHDAGRSDQSGRRPRGGRMPWPVFGGRRPRSERSHYDDDAYSYATGRTATDMLYGAGGRSERSYGGGGHIHTRYNPKRSWADDVYSTSHRSHRSRAWSRSQPSAARTLISGMSRTRRTEATYLDEPEGSNNTHYMDDNPNKFRREVDYNNHTYPRFVIPGWAHIVIGIFLIGIGIADIAWTANKYDNDCAFEKDDIYDPCAAETIYTYIAAPLWGGLLMVLIGALTFLITPYRLMCMEWLVFVYMGGCFFLFIAVCPAIISLSIVLIVENEDTFWADVPGEGLMLKDNTKFALPVVVTILAFVDWIVCALAIIVGLCCPPHSETDFGRNPYESRDYRSYVEPAVVIEEDRTSRRSRRNYPDDIPHLGGAVPKSHDRRSESGLSRGDRIVYEERISPDGHVSRGGPRGDSRYDDELISIGESRHSRDRRSYAPSEDYRRGGRDYARSDRSHDILTLY